MSAYGLPELPPDLRGLNVRDFFEEAARSAPDRAFLVTREREHTYAEIDERTNRAARAWQELGVRKGDRVCVMLDNSPEFLVAWLGLAKAGGVLVAVNTRWRAAEVEYAIGLTEPLLVVAGGTHLETVRAAGAEGALPFGEVMERATQASPEFERFPLAADDLVSFIFTSGTTGYPKAVMQSHGNYVLTGQAYPTWVGLQDGERIYGCLPLFHVNMQCYSTMGAIGTRGAIILVEKFSASRFWDDVRDHRATIFNYIGAVIAILMKLEPGPHERDHQLRIFYGAPSFPEEQRRAIEERYGVAVMSGFGMSETTFGMVEDPWSPRPSGAIGRPRLHPHPDFVNEARIVDDDGVDVPVGTVGELLLRNPAIMKGYWADPEKSAETLAGGWLHTGDFARLDEAGFYYYVDRKKDIVRRRGENISSVEVEVTLNSHPAVEEAAVIGVPSELTDEEVLAFVILRPGEAPPAEELCGWCAERLADFKVPRFVQVVSTLPKTATGKVEKAKLKEGWADPGAWFDREAGGASR